MDFAKETVLPNAYYLAGATYGAVEGLAKGTLGLFKGESAKSKEANTKDYMSTYKQGEDYKATGKQQYESTKSSADHKVTNFYNSTQDKTHSAKDTAVQKTHEVKHEAKAHADDTEDETLSKSEKAKEKVKDAMHTMKHKVKHAAHKVHTVGHKMVHPNENH